MSNLFGWFKKDKSKLKSSTTKSGDNISLISTKQISEEFSHINDNHADEINTEMEIISVKTEISFQPNDIGKKRMN
jgi:hypothetical protein